MSRAILCLWRSPALGVVAIAGLLVEVLVPAADIHVLAWLHARLLWVLLEVGDVMRCVTSLEDSIGR